MILHPVTVVSFLQLCAYVWQLHLSIRLCFRTLRGSMALYPSLPIPCLYLSTYTPISFHLSHKGLVLGTESLLSLLLCFGTLTKKKCYLMQHCGTWQLIWWLRHLLGDWQVSSTYNMEVLHNGVINTQNVAKWGGMRFHQATHSCMLLET